MVQAGRKGCGSFLERGCLARRLTPRTKSSPGPRAPRDPLPARYLVDAPEASMALAGGSLFRRAVLLRHRPRNTCGFKGERVTRCTWAKPGVDVIGVEAELQNLAASKMWSLLTTYMWSFSHSANVPLASTMHHRHRDSQDPHFTEGNPEAQ